jgi:hypothetical protein
MVCYHKRMKKRDLLRETAKGTVKTTLGAGLGALSSLAGAVSGGKYNPRGSSVPANTFGKDQPDYRRGYNATSAPGAALFNARKRLSAPPKRAPKPTQSNMPAPLRDIKNPAANRPKFPEQLRKAKPMLPLEGLKKKKLIQPQAPRPR